MALYSRQLNSLRDNPRVSRDAASTAVVCKKTILYLDHTAALGGGELALLALVRSLNGERYSPSVILCADGPLADRLREIGIETRILPLSPSILHSSKDGLNSATLFRIKDAVQTLHYVGRLAKLIKAIDPSIVHTNSLKADIMGGIAARLAGKPVLWHVRDRIEPDYLPTPVVRIFRWLCRVLPNFVVANSEATLSTVALRRKDRCAVVYSGVEAAHLLIDSEDPLPVGSSPQSGASSENMLIGLVGRISPWKGQHIFLEAARIVKSRFPNARFQIIGAALHGEDAYEEKVRHMAQTLGLSADVAFMGFRGDVPQLMNKLDVLVHASTTGEPFGQVVVQGMAAGKPVVATNGGGIPEIVEDGVTGVLVPMGDASALAEGICQILLDPEAARAMGRKGRQRVRERFTLDQSVRKMEGIYDSMAPDGGSGRKNAAGLTAHITRS